MSFSGGNISCEEVHELREGHHCFTRDKHRDNRIAGVDAFGLTSGTSWALWVSSD